MAKPCQNALLNLHDRPFAALFLKQPKKWRGGNACHSARKALLEQKTIALPPKLVDAFCALSTHHEKIHFRWRPFLPDRDDEFILDLVVVAQCDYIVTYNKKDFAGVEKFGIKISDPKAFLQEIGEIP